jgi:hypothetical protein
MSALAESWSITTSGEGGGARLLRDLVRGGLAEEHVPAAAALVLVLDADAPCSRWAGVRLDARERKCLVCGAPIVTVGARTRTTCSAQCRKSLSRARRRERRKAER